VREIEEFANGVWETSKLGGTPFMWLFQIGVFTWFNCAFVTTQHISIVGLPQIGEIANGVWETSKLGESRLNWLFPIGAFT
jgi:hypothetical protein